MPWMWMWIFYIFTIFLFMPSCLQLKFFTFYCGFAEVKLTSASVTLYSLSPSCISLLSRTIKMSGLEVAMAHVAGPTHTQTKLKNKAKSQ